MILFATILAIAILYAVPGLVATARRHPEMTKIWLLDLGLGFTVLGWVAALVWAIRGRVAKAAIPVRRYNYSYADGGKGRAMRVNPLAPMLNMAHADIGLALACIAAVALIGTLAWQRVAPAAATSFAAPAMAATTGPAWTYTSDQDTAKGATTRAATLMSDSDPAAPTAGPATLTLRSGPDGMQAALSIDDQFVCSVGQGIVTAHFDKDPPEAFVCGPHADSDTLPLSLHNALFVSQPASFVSRLASAHHVMLEAEVLGHGTRQMTFTAQGLNLEQAGLPAQLAATPIPAVGANAATEASATGSVAPAGEASSSVATASSAESVAETPKAEAKGEHGKSRARRTRTPPKPHYASWKEK